ncbi:carbohydrate-binding family 9-like protein [Rhodocytophaga rosea]|uniref:Carbohydrate-binding family 9-like protein n=1 Tax=Rhodocytophaga rosea TaxID=2704465 RepID=A0A6C0GWD4_9BACT|nr:carbohydrate-binding family 9-like protein [Rhodocytophaga rosea]
MKRLFLLLLPYSLLAQGSSPGFSPEHYICYQTHTPLQIDGKLSEQDWANASWTKEFVDIEGALKPAPRFKTQVKMLWDQQYFYIAAQLYEPEIWATLTERESVIFHDNDFEVFIDPDGDTHNYLEFEINALGTEWDLLLTKPYRDGGKPINHWNIKGLKAGIHIEGSLNDPATKDQYWTIEMAFPWDVLQEVAFANRKPEHGEQWRVNFSRVEWQTEIINQHHQKKIDPATSKSYPEDNWVWSPQGVINMHRPESWGFVQFSTNKVGNSQDTFIASDEEPIKWALRQLYYAQQQWKKKHKRYTTNLSDLKVAPPTIKEYVFEPKLFCTPSLFEITAKSKKGTFNWHIRQDGLIWKE